MNTKENVKHTPGPWELNEQDENTYVEPIHLKNGWDACQFSNSNEESLANARLIASAPELLEACKSAMAYFKEYQGLDALKLAELALKLTMAINKAEGREV